jgi:hypothetical protein
MAAMNRRLARGLLRIGIAIVVVNGYLLFALYGPGAHQEGPSPMFATPPDAFPINFVPILAFAASVLGLWHMWRVWRGSR